MTRRGRRPGQSDTRQKILEVARTAFAEVGYERATIRLIAASAGVDPALVHHYYGSKEDLFAAAVDLPFRPAEAWDMVFAGGIDEVGVRLARLFFTIWESEPSRAALLGQLRRAMVTPGEAGPFAEFVADALLPRAVANMIGSDRGLRAELAVSHLVGLAILRYVVRMEPVASAPVESLIEKVAPRIQAYVSGASETGP